MKIIISENQVDKIKSKIHEYVKKYGIEKCKEIFGDKVLLTIGFNNDPMEFLNLFNNLKQVQSTLVEGWSLFQDEKGVTHILNINRTNMTYFDYITITKPLTFFFNLEPRTRDKLLKKWLELNYGIFHRQISYDYLTGLH
jgi:hypothetical protein